MTNPDGEISMDEVITRVYYSVEYEATREVEIEEGVQAEEYVGEFKDNQTTAGTDWFRQLEYREAAFRDHYPFCVKNNRLICRYDLSEKQRLYTFLLLCSGLRMVTRKHWHLLTTAFELVSAKALEGYLPGFTVHHFGKTPAGDRQYSNKLVEAIDQLANNLRERNISQPEHIGDKNTGDGGLDVVAWRHAYHQDYAPGSLICFCQCTCSNEWVNKQDESHYINWQRRINFIHRPANLIFIPFCFRDSSGGWFAEHRIRESVLIDRLRICFLVSAIGIPQIGFCFCQVIDSFYEYIEGSSS